MVSRHVSWHGVMSWHIYVMVKTLSNLGQALLQTSNELWTGWKLAWYHHFTHIACARKYRGLRQKLDSLRCTKWTISFEVSGFHTETRLLQRDFNFFELIRTPLFFYVQNAPFKATSSIYNPFWLHLLFFIHLLIILSYKTMKLKSIWNELWKGSKLA